MMSVRSCERLHFRGSGLVGQAAAAEEEMKEFHGRPPDDRGEAGEPP